MPNLEAISLDDLTTITGGCGGKKKCCPCPQPQPQQAAPAPQLPPSDNVSVNVNYQQGG